MIFVENDVMVIQREIEQLELSCNGCRAMYSLGAINALQWILTNKVRPTKIVQRTGNENNKDNE